jgi:hypothetical protein
VASQTQSDAHVRKTAGTSGAASEIEEGKLTGSGVITPPVSTLNSFSDASKSTCS